MNYNQILQRIDKKYKDALDFVHSFKSQLIKSEFEDINIRREESTPSVFLSFNNIRLITFDLRIGGGVGVIFWQNELLSRKDIEQFQMSIQQHTGWTGFSLSNNSDVNEYEQKQFIIEYWLRGLNKVAKGELGAIWKREQKIISLTKQAFPDYSVICNKQSLSGINAKPDIYIQEINVVI